MHFSLILAAAAAGALALPSSVYVTHESIGGERNRWKRSARVDEDAIIPLRIGLAQRNLHTGYDRLMEVAHPSSKKFGKHLSPEEVHEIFAPHEETSAAVREWLHSAGIKAEDVMHFENKGWLGVDLPVKDAERLFATQYYEHENVKGEVRLGCDEYSVPGHLVEHIDYITPGVRLSAPMRKRAVQKRDGSDFGGWKPGPGHHGPPHFPPGHYGPWHKPPGAGQLPAELQDCARNFTPPCYRAIYNIPNAYEKGWNVSGNSLGLYESGDTYSQEDLNLFYKSYAPYIPAGTAPIPAFIDGAQAPVPAASEDNTGESDIDLAITISLIYPQTVTLYQTDDRPQSDAELEGELEGFLNTFLDALDGSYCNYTAYGITGDTPGIDAQYPDPAPGGYKGPKMCGTYKPTKVISGSYGEAEADLPQKYTQRQCNEFMKLGLQGHSIFFSSSDYGVASYPGDVTPSGCLSGSGQNQTIYNPDYPANCPYLTAVGATQLNPDQTIKDPESAMQTPLGPGPLQYFASAGGFSNYFSAPSYQKKAVSSYFSNNDPGHPYYTANADASNVGADGGIYNRAGRGYPDVSANGANFRMYNNLTDEHWFGTSLAAPLWAAVATLINEERTLAGKGPIGFVNPTLYAHPWALTDIKNGSNPNCGSSGFEAVEGWDPVTGLGTPNYPKLIDLYLRLP
ncbi:serine endopeptidase [Polychaeton citri CBS 116435]|uniref:tripeptidyl-peptidase II n=1 Tax=Polychaeton citri CBS 116435 TaxID=1314669 RepID=A0A9P4QBT8_9PEZI|nr:serine endopeptidase [Polychaeton citri CBS 116435]